MRALGLLGGVVALTAGVTIFVSGNPPNNEFKAVEFSAAGVHLHKPYMTPDQMWFQAFIPTGSVDGRILVTTNHQYFLGSGLPMIGAHVTQHKSLERKRGRSSFSVRERDAIA